MIEVFLAVTLFLLPFFAGWILGYAHAAGNYEQLNIGVIISEPLKPEVRERLREILIAFIKETENRGTDARH